MANYKAPLRDMQFVLNEVFDIGEISKLPGYADASPDVITAVLEEAAKLCENELFPLNLSGDKEGCLYENGVVRTPKGFKEAYNTFREGGWTSLACDPKYGGQGLPKSVHFVVEEMICSSNMAFGMYPGLSSGAYNAIELHASEELKNRYLPKITDGSWSGTMCLTEPQCGTDLGMLRTRAVPQADGSYKITGTKIFISAGEHDLTENIVHLVLARLPDAPPGIKGISLFLVPKYLPKESGGTVHVGPSNGVVCPSIEHKMGIKASATCVIVFEASTGWMIGEKHKGMRAMFAMMNAARLGVGIQGLGLAEVSYQAARDYAKDRIQGRALKGAKAKDKVADPLIVHPDIRRMLLDIKSVTEPARALAYWIGMQIDVLLKHPDPAVRQEADDLVALMTPIIKSFMTDHGFDAANLAVQVHGGHGYIHETGVEQYVRDARITQIYEGANGIQALDLIGRKMPEGGGRLLRRFFHPVQAFIEANGADPQMAEFVGPLAKAFARLQQVTLWMAQQGLANPEDPAAGASDYLKMFGLVVLGYMWCRMVKTALPKAAVDTTGFYQSKIETARYFFAKVLPDHASLALSITAGSKPVMAMAEAAF
ncbi:MAG: acyl-CoA dehydrogenase C-terminal domain-containing protein [Alphaproteobacteria bacterium]